MTGTEVPGDVHATVARARQRAAELRERSVQVLATADAVVAEARSGQAARVAEQRVCELAAEVDRLRRAMASRAAIEQAKGVIIAAVGCDAATAFEVLVKQSQHENRKLREVAEDLVASKVRVQPEPEVRRLG